MSSNQDTSTLEPDMCVIEAAQEESLGRSINRLNLKRFTEKERCGYNVLLTDEVKDVLEVFLERSYIMLFPQQHRF